jgi:hypothetical protein
MKRSKPKNRKLFASSGGSHSLRGGVDEYLAWLLVTNHSERTVMFREEVFNAQCCFGFFLHTSAERNFLLSKRPRLSASRENEFA